MNNQRTLSHSLWDYLCSLKLAMLLLLSLAITSIIGTVIPQGNLAPQYVQSIGPTKLKLYQSLGFFDMYHSWWFVLLLTGLSVNLFACSLKRLPQIWKTVTQPTEVMDDGLQKSLPNLEVITASGSPQALKEKLVDLLGSSFAEPRVTERGGEIHLFAQKAPWCRLAVYAVHLSILVIFVGAIAGSLLGFKAYVNIPEGKTITRVDLFKGHQKKDLGFQLRCDKFTASFYDTGAPKEFKSLLTVLENGQPVPGYSQVPVIVNDPLTYKGITFYQSSYGKFGEHKFTVSNPDGSSPVAVTIPTDGEARLPDGGAVHVLESTTDVSPFEPGKTGAAANLEIHTGTGRTYRSVAYANYPEINRQASLKNGGLLFDYVTGYEVTYTGLQVAKDPGVPIVWLGCLIMVIGVYCAFFVTHRRVWVRIAGSEVAIGGSANKNPAGFEMDFQRLVERIRGEL